jgi:acyl carrier protein
MNLQDRADTLRQTLSAVLGVATTELTDDSSPDSLPSWDSVAHLNLVVALEEAFGVAFSPEETMELTSVRLIRLMLDEKLGQD